MDIIKAVEYDKVWGKEVWLANNELYCGKLLVLDKDYRCSYHYHEIKDETFYILRGHVGMKVEGEEFELHPGDTIRLMPGMRHTFTGLEDSIIIEISTQHFEDDSYREDKSDKIR